MKALQIVETVQKYATSLAPRFEVRRHPTNAVAPSTQDAMEHVLWMCVQVQEFVAQGKLEKANRWLGFIQGILWLSGRGSVDDFREDNRDGWCGPES